MEDFLGNSLKPGDSIVYSHQVSPSHQLLRLAKVKHIADSGRIYLEKIDRNVKMWTVKDRVMKLTQ